MAAGHYGLAVGSFRKALANEPVSIKALNGLAATYDLLGRFDLAERYYRQALAFDPKSVQSLNNLGYSYYLRGEFGRARGLFERAARIDGKNSIVVGNLASLDKAEMGRQVAAAAKQGSKATGGKGATAPYQTTWIERSNRRVQALVTKPDPAMVKAARDHRVEPRMVHTPKPLIEITTVAPVIVAMKPASAPAFAAVASKPAILRVEPKAPRTRAIMRTQSVEIDAPARIVEISTRVGRPQAGPGAAASVPAPETASMKVVEPESYALIGSSAETRPVKPDIADGGMADLPKLNEDAAHDVRAALVKTETTARAKSGAAPAMGGPPVPAPIVAPPPDWADRPVEIAALAIDIEAAAPAMGEPPVPAPVVVKAPDRVDRPVKFAALAIGIEAAAPAMGGPPVPAPVVAPAPDRVDRPVKMAALSAKAEPARTGSGKALGKGKLTPKDAADRLVALKRAVRLEISNGAGRLRMAARMGRYLVGRGMSNSRLTNAKSFTNQVSVLYFKPGHIANAKSLRGVLPVHPDLRRNVALETDLRLVLGGDLLSFDRGLISKYSD